MFSLSPSLSFFSADSRSSCFRLDTTATRTVLLRGLVAIIFANNFVDLLKLFPGGSTPRNFWYKCREYPGTDNCEEWYFQVTLKFDSVSEEALRWLRDTGAELGRKHFLSYFFSWISASSF